MRDSLAPNRPADVRKSYMSANAATNVSPYGQKGPVLAPEQQQEATPGPSKTTIRQGTYAQALHLLSPRPKITITDSVPLTSLPRKNEVGTFGTAPNSEALEIGGPPSLTSIIPTGVTPETETPVVKQLRGHGRGGAGKVVGRDKGNGKERATDIESGGTPTPMSTNSSARVSLFAPSLMSQISNGDDVEGEGVVIAPVRLVVKKRSVKGLGGFGRGGAGSQMVIGEGIPAVLSVVPPSPIMHRGDADGSIRGLAENLGVGSSAAATQNSDGRPTMAERERPVPKPVVARGSGRGGAGKVMTVPSGERSSKGKEKAKEKEKEKDKGKDEEKKRGREPRHAWFRHPGSTTSHPSGTGGSGQRQEPCPPPRLPRAINESSPPPPSRPLLTPPQPGPSQPSSNSPPPVYITGNHPQPHHDLLSLVPSKTRRWPSPATQAPTQKTRKESKRRPKVQPDTIAAAAVPPIIIVRPSQEEEEEEFPAPPPPYEQVEPDSPVSAVTL